MPKRFLALSLLLLFSSAGAATAQQADAWDFLQSIVADSTEASLGFEKLTTDEQQEWAKLLHAVYEMGYSDGKADKPPSSILSRALSLNAAEVFTKLSPGMAAYVTTVMRTAEDTVMLANGGAVEMIVPSTAWASPGVEAVLAIHPHHCSLWIGSARGAACRITRSPAGNPEIGRQLILQEVHDFGETLVVRGGLSFEVNSLDRQTARLLKPGQPVLLVGPGQILDPNGSQFIRVKRIQ